MKKLLAGIVAVAAMASVCAKVSAVDWSAASYADGNPDTCHILSTDENGCEFEQVIPNELSKIRLTWADVLENPDDLSKVYSGSWQITYKGLSSLSGTDCGWLGGGTYVSTGNSATYGLSPNDWDENGMAVWEDEQTVEDTFKWLLPTSVPEDTTAEIVIMDWSGRDMAGITFYVHDFKIFDKEGNEIPTKAYGAGGAAAEEAPAEEATVEEAPAEEAAAEEAAAVEEAPAEEAAPAAEEAPAAETTTDSTPTGNASAAAVAAVMGVAAVAAFVSRKK